MNTELQNEIEAFLVFDWKMRYLPFHVIQSQSAWYGQKGIAIGGFQLTLRGGDGKLHTSYLMYTTDDRKEDWWSQATLSSAAIKWITENHPAVFSQQQ